MSLMTSIKRRTHLGRLKVAHPDTLNTIDGSQLRQQLFQGSDVAQVFAKGGGVLTDQEEFADALVNEPLRLVNDVSG